MSNLLRTRVEIEQQQSSQALLATMNSRQGFAAQDAVHGGGLSVAAISYYIVGLVSYVARARNTPAGPQRRNDLGHCHSLCGGGVWWSLRQLHHRIFANLIDWINQNTKPNRTPKLPSVHCRT